MDTIIAGFQFGDEGKGSVVDYLANNESLVIRFNGGSQAAHHVVTPQKVTHRFAQFGSGSFRQGSVTYLSPFMLVDPLAILTEGEVLTQKGAINVFSRLYIDTRCPVITPFHRIINQMREIATDHQKGSCGAGVGETVNDLAWLGEHLPRVGDFFYPQVLRYKLDFLWRIKQDIAEQIVDEHPDNDILQSLYRELRIPDFVQKLCLEYQKFAQESGIHIIDSPLPDWSGRNIIYEGAQGTLLDQQYGFIPFITKTKTTFKNADLLQHNFQRETEHLGIMRAYTTRHGPGPLPTEYFPLSDFVPDVHNRNNKWQMQFRVGWFDLVLARYSLGMPGNKADSLAVTNLDRLDNLPSTKICTSYTLDNPPDDIDEYFVCQIKGNLATISDIKITNVPNPDHQIKLTELLLRCQPQYQEFPSWKSRGDANQNRYLAYIETELKTPIKIVSFGPTRLDKELRS